MIYRLRKKFIGIVSLSFIAVFIILLCSIYIFTSIQTNTELDNLADIVSANNGRFPEFDDPASGGNQPYRPHGLDRESPFTTRFFTVRFDRSGNLISVDIRSVASVTTDEAVSYAGEVMVSGKERGWKNDFRYKKYDTSGGTAVVFVNGSLIKGTNRNFLLTSVVVFIGGSFVVLLLVIFFSKWAVKPTAESYEKQKQFITDANHELKTPLTIIRTDLEILEAESEPNEWLSDIREETETMAGLVNRLVTLARMDEDQTKLCISEFNLSEAVAETVSLFAAAAGQQNKTLSVNIAPPVQYAGDEAAIRQVVSVLMDNAVKYCDPKGVICVSLCGGKHPVLTIDNTYSAAGTIELNRLFDRFYRADKARTSGNGFGIGLSIAKAIVEKHNGSITVHNPGNEMIRFQIRL